MKFCILLSLFASHLVLANPKICTNCQQSLDSEAQIVPAEELFYAALMPMAYRSLIRNYYQSASFEKVLCLSIGQDRSPLGLATRVLPGVVQVYATDIEGREQRVATDNFHYLYHDNNRPFAFADQSFQAITMRCGLCVCTSKSWWQTPTTCAGLKMRTQDLQKFFLEILRLLDDNNSKSFAVFEGCPGKVYEEILLKSLQPLFRYHPIWELRVIRSQGKVQGVMITHH